MIIVLGIAGSGKSTQCKALSDSGNYRWVSMSGLLKEHETPEIRNYMLNGIMVPNEIAVPLVEKDLALRGDSPEILLDGFPRTLAQAQAFVDDKTLLPRKVVHLVVTEEEATRRLSERQRVDDTPEAIHRRFTDYHRDIDPILAIFASAGVEVLNIDANPAANDVTKVIEKELRRDG